MVIAPIYYGLRESSKKTWVEWERERKRAANLK